MIGDLKTAKKIDLEIMAYRIEFTFIEYINVLDSNFIGAKTTSYTLPPPIYKISDLNLMLESLNFNEVNVKITNN